MSSVTVEVIEELIDSGVSDFVSNGGSLPDVIAMSRETLDLIIYASFKKDGLCWNPGILEKREKMFLEPRAYSILGCRVEIKESLDLLEFVFKSSCEPQIEHKFDFEGKNVDVYWNPKTRTMKIGADGDNFSISDGLANRWEVFDDSGRTIIKVFYDEELFVATCLVTGIRREDKDFLKAISMIIYETY